MSDHFNCPHSVAHNANTLIGHRKSIGLAVSGGSDSMAMMNLFARWTRHRKIIVRVVTVNHSVNRHSAAIADRVVKEAHKLNLECDTLVRTGSRHRPSQARLRQDRYRLICHWARNRNINTIAVAHTADDLIETLWMRLQAESHWFGLASPLPVAPAPVWPHGLGVRIVRPLLTVRRSTLKALLSANNMTWHDDPANCDQTYKRTQIRQHTHLLDDDQHALWTRIWWRLAQARQSMTQTLNRLCQTQMEWKPDGSVRGDRTVLSDNPPVVANALLGVVIQSVSGREHAVTSRRCDTLRQRILNATTPLTTTLAGAWIRAGKKHVEIAAAPQKHARTPGARVIEPIYMTPGAERIWDGRFALTLDSPRPQMVLGGDAATSTQCTYADLVGSEKISAMARRTLPVFSGHGHLTGTALHARRALDLLIDPMVSEIRNAS